MGFIALGTNWAIARSDGKSEVISLVPHQLYLEPNWRKQVINIAKKPENIMDTAPRLPDSTVAMLVESLTAYSVGGKPNCIGTLTVFGNGDQLVGAIDLGDQENPKAVSKDEAQQMMEVARGLVVTAKSFDNLMKYIKVGYKDRELLVIPGEQYNVATVIDSTE